MPLGAPPPHYSNFLGFMGHGPPPVRANRISIMDGRVHADMYFFNPQTDISAVTLRLDSLGEHRFEKRNVLREIKIRSQNIFFLFFYVFLLGRKT